MAAKQVLYDRLGGVEAVDAAVELIYVKIKADDRINAHFVNTDMTRLKMMMKNFMGFAFGGPGAYKGRDMRKAHAHLSLKEADFDAVAENFVATLQELGVAQATIDDAVAVVLTTKAAILNLPEPTAVA